jgi:polysaccharide pyruvyl transferase WcaK-like protein
LLRAAPKQDLVVVGGGGLFQDDDSRVKMPYWAARIALLRALNRRIVGHSVGAGPLEHLESRASARVACQSLRSVSVRDGFARKWLSDSIGRDVSVVPDPAFMLQPAPVAKARALVSSVGLSPDRPIIAVSLRRWFHRRGGFMPHKIRAGLGLDRGEGKHEMERVRWDMARTLRALSRRLDAQVLLMPSYHSAHEGDAGECEQLLAQLGGVKAAIARIADPALYKAVAGRASLMISARMHPLILAAGMGVPIVGLAYNGKFDGVFNLLERRHGLLWLEDFRCGSRAQQLEKTALAALGEPNKLADRAAHLASQAFGATQELVREATA